MTIEEALKQAGDLIDKQAEKSLSDYETLLREHGATDDELADELAHMRADCIKEKERCLAQARAWLKVCCLESEIDKLKKELDVARARCESWVGLEQGPLT
jgi:hypothetical protein